jgi:hypothetical protein
MLLVRAGNAVVEVNWHGSAPDMSWASAVVGQVLHTGAKNSLKLQ